MNRIVRATSVALLLAASVGAPSMAVARDHYRWIDPAEVVPEGVVPGFYRYDGQACVKQCQNDSTPCDPAYFKQADGRCSGRIAN